MHFQSEKGWNGVGKGWKLEKDFSDLFLTISNRFQILILEKCYNGQKWIRNGQNWKSQHLYVHASSLNFHKLTQSKKLRKQMQSLLTACHTHGTQS